MSDSLLPPRKKDWKPGHAQIGLFIRGKDGSKVEIVTHDASDDEYTQAIQLLLALATRRSVETANASADAKSTAP